MSLRKNGAQLSIFSAHDTGLKVNAVRDAAKEIGVPTHRKTQGSA